MALLPANKQQGLPDGSPGLTIIGVLVAALLLTTAVLTMMQLLAKTSTLTGLAEEKFTAVNVAREGLELVRAQRDTNWFQADPSKPWFNQLCGTFTIEPDTSGAIFIKADPSPANQKLYFDENGFWSHQSAGQDSHYSRVITAQPLTFDPTTQLEQATDCNDPKIAALDIASVVSWTDRGQPQQVTIREKLYDWYNSGK